MTYHQYMFFSQSEKAEALKEIKKLESQRSFLERDLKKHDSLAGKRNEVNSDLAGFFGQAVQMEVTISLFIFLILCKYLGSSQ